jgi:hypothetical protein
MVISILMSHNIARWLTRDEGATHRREFVQGSRIEHPRGRRVGGVGAVSREPPSLGSPTARERGSCSRDSLVGL